MAGDMGCKNRLVIVKEKLELERCTVYGLDNEEREEFYHKSQETAVDWRGKITLNP